MSEHVQISLERFMFLNKLATTFDDLYAKGVYFNPGVGFEKLVILNETETETALKNEIMLLQNENKSLKAELKQAKAELNKPKGFWSWLLR